MVDTSLPMSLGSFLNCVVNVVGSLLVIAFVSPAQLAALIPLGFFYEWYRRLYVSTSRELKRLDSLAMSPIFGNFGETLQVPVLPLPMFLTLIKPCLKSFILQPSASASLRSAGIVLCRCTSVRNPPCKTLASSDACAVVQEWKG